jgi:uncharacterized protein with HEPN domain
MRPEARKLLFDVKQAADRIVEFTRGKDLSGYSSDPMLVSAVERHFEIVGEAPNQLARLDPDVVREVSEHQRIIAFRNVFIHGYSAVDDAVVWDIVQHKLPVLRGEVERLLSSEGSPQG